MCLSLGFSIMRSFKSASVVSGQRSTNVRKISVQLITVKDHGGGASETAALLSVLMLYTIAGMPGSCFVIWSLALVMMADPRHAGISCCVEVRN